MDDCIGRDVKGPYEELEVPEVTVDTESETPEERADSILSKLQKMCYLRP